MIRETRPRLYWVDLGLVPFPDADLLQTELAERRNRFNHDILLFAEHPPSYTFGARAQSGGVLWPAAFLRDRGIESHLTSRGGEPLYHATGQIAGYAIYDTGAHELSPRSFVALIERALLLVLRDFGISDFAPARAPGLWVTDGQLATFGVHLSRGISRYGFTLNVDPDLSPCAEAPCGKIPATSIRNLGIPATTSDLIPRIAAAFGVVFHQQANRVEADDLRKLLTQ